MFPKGHLGVSLILYSPIAALLIINSLFLEAAFGLAVFVGLSSLPDIDVKISFIKHRGITHTVWFAIIIALIPTIITMNIPKEYIGFIGFGNYTTPLIFILSFLAVMSHIVGDAITPYGVAPLSIGALQNIPPFENYTHITEKNYGITITTAGNDLANFLFLKIGTFTIFIFVTASALYNFGLLFDVIGIGLDLGKSAYEFVINNI